MEIIIEETLTINFFVIFSILRFVGAVTRQKVKFIFLSSLCGAIIACAYPALCLPNGIEYLILFSLISILTLFSFDYKNIKNFILNYSLILLSTFCLGGACLALQSAVGTFPIFIVAILGIFLFAVLSIITKSLRRKGNLQKFTFKLTLRDGEKVVEEEGYLDSGNVLYDTMTNNPIVLINFQVFKKFYDNVDYFNARMQKINSSSIKNAHYIKINGIGSGTSMLVFTIDELRLEDKFFKNVSLGLSF